MIITVMHNQRIFLILVIFSLVALLPIFQPSLSFATNGNTISNSVDADNSTNFQDNCSGNPLVYFQTDNDRFLTGSKIPVNGKVFDSCGNPLKTDVTIELFKIDPFDTTKSLESQFLEKQNLVLVTSLQSDSGEFSEDIEYRKLDHKNFAIKTSVNVDGTEAFSFRPIQILGFQETGVGIGIYAEIFFIACLLTLIYAQLRHGWSLPSIEPFRFALLTLCSVIPIIIFIAADVQLGQDGPFGFVVQHIEEPIKEITFERLTEQTGTVEVSQEENIVSKFEWVINVGGNPMDNYSTGIQIPVFVLIFGLVGGYLRFLRKTSQGWIAEKITEAVDFFNNKKGALPMWAKKTSAELIANRYYITTPGGEVFNRIATCHICNMHKDFIQASDENNKGEPICPECFRKRSKSCNYCKLNVIKKIKEIELELMQIEYDIRDKKTEIEKYEEEIELNDDDGYIPKKLELLKGDLQKLRAKRRTRKINLEPLYIQRTTEIHRGRCKNILQQDDLKSLNLSDENSNEIKTKVGISEGKVCNRINLDNKHKIRTWKDKSKLQKRFYPQVSRAIFNNSMEDLALIFLPPVLAFALYFVLLQAGITAQENMPTIAAVSLATGLITKEALQRLETLGKGFLVGEKKTSDDEVKKIEEDLKGYQEKEKEALEKEIVDLKNEVKKSKAKLEQNNSN